MNGRITLGGTEIRTFSVPLCLSAHVKLRLTGAGDTMRVRTTHRLLIGAAVLLECLVQQFGQPVPGE